VLEGGGSADEEGKELMKNWWLAILYRIAKELEEQAINE
jgi:hypothetical protein